MPLISVMMPCYNATKTLSFALASLIAQSYENWECILVDDGSTDNPHSIVEQMQEQRIKYIKLHKNMGRGFARQLALDNSTGKYLCMLDADDWFYPSKLEQQIRLMESEPQLALISTGMAIVDSMNKLVGIRSLGSSTSEIKVLGPLTKLSMPPVAHAPSIIRMSLAKQIKYDAQFTLAQDVDFLLQLLIDRYYAILPEVTYVYSEHSSVNPQKIVTALFFTREMFRKHKKRFPVTSRTNIARVFVKSVIYQLAFRLGFGNWMISRRSQLPTNSDKERFLDARNQVLSTLSQKSLF